MNYSNNNVQEISEYYQQIINKMNQDDYSFRLKKKNILNKSNILFTEIIINYCQDLRSKLDALSSEFKGSSQIKNKGSNNIIQSLAEMCFFQNNLDYKKNLLMELESFYQIMSELNSILISKFKFTLINIIGEIIPEYKVNDSIIFVDELKRSIPCTVVKVIKEGQIYQVKKLTDGVSLEKNKNELFPDIIDFFIKGRDNKSNLYSMVKYICRLLANNEEGFEIKLYLMYTVMPVNLLQRKFILDDSKYFTLNQPVFVWSDSPTFEKMKFVNISKTSNMNDLEINYNSLYNENLKLPPNTEIEIIYEEPVLSWNYKLLFDNNKTKIKDNMTRYVKVMDKRNSNIYWIQLSDIVFQTINDTYFYSYEKKMKRNLLKKEDSIILNNNILEQNNNIILPDKDTDKVLFLTPVTLYSEYFITVGSRVSNKRTGISGKVLYFDEKTNKYLVEADDKYGAAGWKYGLGGGVALATASIALIGAPLVVTTLTTTIGGPGLGWIIKKLDKKWGNKGYENIVRSFSREALIWEDYKSVDGYISLEDTNCHMLTENNLNGLLFKYLDKNILENLFFLYPPINNLRDDEQIEFDHLEKNVGIKKETLESIYMHSSNANLSRFKQTTLSLYEKASFANIINLGTVIGLFNLPVTTIMAWGGMGMLNKFYKYLTLLKKKNIDPNKIHYLNVKNYFGQDLEKLIFQCLKYDYRFGNTQVLLDAIFRDNINDEFQIEEKGYEILSFFLKFSRIDPENQIEVYTIFKTLLSKIVSSEQVSYFLFDLLNFNNLEDYHEEIAKEYLRNICNFHYLSVNNLVLDPSINMNLKLKKYLYDYSNFKLNRLQPMIDFLEISIPNDDNTLEKYRVIKQCIVSDQNNKLYNIEKDTLVFKKKDSFPFLSTDLNDKFDKNNNYFPKKLFVSVIRNFNNSPIILNIPRNNIEYSLSETD